MGKFRIPSDVGGSMLAFFNVVADRAGLRTSIDNIATRLFSAQAWGGWTTTFGRRT